MPTMELYVLGAGAVLLALQLIVTVIFVRALRRLRPIEDRVAQFGDALGLLTEAAESGFRATVSEIERLGGKTARRPDVPVAARVTAAARQGVEAKHIAAREQLSEGEVHLCLSLAEQGQAAERAPRRASRPRRKKDADRGEWAAAGEAPSGGSWNSE